MTTVKEDITPQKAFEILCEQLKKKPAAQKLIMAHLRAVTGSSSPLPLYHKTFCSSCKQPDYCETCAKERVDMYRTMVQAIMSNSYGILQGQVGAGDKRADPVEVAAVAAPKKEAVTQATTPKPPPEPTTGSQVTPPVRSVKPTDVQHDDDLTSLLIRRLTPHFPKQAMLDEGRVRSLVDEQMGKFKLNRNEIETIALGVVKHAMSNGEFPVDRVNAIVKEAMDGAVAIIHVKHPNGETVNVGRQHYRFPLIIKCIENRIPFILVGPAGSSKTSAVEAAAKAASMEFEAMSVGPMTSKADIFGFRDANGQYHETSTVRRAVNGGIMLWDEIDAGNAGVLTSANMLLSNQHVATPDGMRTKHADFCMGGTANTYGMGANRVYVGRNQLDGATLDRFAVIDWGYDEGFEASLVGVPKASPVLSLDDGGIMQPKEWIEWLHKIRRSTEHLSIRHIVSPRATINGVKLFDSGVGRTHVEEMVLWKGLDSATRQKIVAAIQ